ncbi:MAG: 6-hydroxymethylpterin diphosphokinase MptE-like protein [Geminicoccaceae bacterium]
MRSVWHARLKAHTPPPLWRLLRAGYHGAIVRPAWRWSPRARASRRRLQAYRDRHQGERCFIIGNGPSLNRIDLTPLRTEVTFGLNRIYLLSGRLGFRPTYYVCVNRLVLEQFASEIAAVPAPKFLGWDGRHALTFDDTMVLLRSQETPSFAADPGEGLWEGSTVTYVALQLAFFMGFTTVVLIGVDHRFSAGGPPGEVVVARHPDAEHFDPRYFGPGVRWQLPDLATSEQAYRMARQHFERHGRRVLDATAGGDLRVFERVDYGGLFRAPARPPRRAAGVA